MNYAFFIVLMLCLSVCAPEGTYAAQGDFVYNSKGNRDPFVSLVTKEGVLIGAWQTSDLDLDDQEVLLEGIIWDPQGESLAIVNGVVVKEGDRFLNLKILEIKQKGIKLLKGNEELIINLITEEGGE